MLSFSEIYRQHAEAVFRLAWMLSGDRSDAEDLTSEAFARALAGAGRIEQATVRSYLYAIVRNLVSSRLRRPAVELPADEEQLSQAAEPDPGPEQRAELRQRLAHASAGLAAMREADRQVLLLCGVQCLSNLEIATNDITRVYAKCRAFARHFSHRYARRIITRYVTGPPAHPCAG